MYIFTFYYFFIFIIFTAFLVFKTRIVCIYGHKGVFIFIYRGSADHRNLKMDRFSSGSLTMTLLIIDT